MSRRQSADSYPHLNDQAREAVALPAPQRCRLILQERWIGYTRAMQALEALQSLASYPARDRMLNMLLIGPTNNGKTKIIRKFTDMHPSYVEGDVRITPVVTMEMPPQPGMGRLYRAILDVIGAPYRKTARVDYLEPFTLELLRKIQTKVLIIDEVHNLLACNALQQRQVLNQLKYIGNQLKIPLIAVGTEEAWSAIKSDPQMANRFERFELPAWSEGDELCQLLMTFESTLPLRRPSNLADEKTAKLILSQSEGTIGSITRFLEAAAVQALESGRERIELEATLSVRA